MPKPSLHIQHFFEEYEQGANSFDIDLNARERAAHWLSASPSGVTLLHNDERFPALLKKRQEQLKRLGFQRALITSLEEVVLDEHYSLVKTAWRQIYQKADQEIPIDITVDYIVRVEESKTVTILCTIAHEDEDALLQEAIHSERVKKKNS